MGAGRQLDDGEYSYQELLGHFTGADFYSESNLCDFIEVNITDFSKDILKDDLLSYEREKSLVSSTRKIKGNRRLDFLLLMKSGQKIGIECKHPRYISEVTYGLGQCLSYILLFQLDKMIIVSSKIDYVVCEIIKKFNLPIEFVVLDRKKYITWINGKTE